MSLHSRKSTRTSPRSTKVSSIIIEHKNARRNLKSSHHPSGSSISHPQSKQKQSDDMSLNLVSTASCSDTKPEGDDGDDNGEADDINEESRDGDVIAPSGSILNGSQNQAGLTAEKKQSQCVTIKESQEPASSSLQFQEHVASSDDDDYDGVDWITDSEAGPTMAQGDEIFTMDSESNFQYYYQPHSESSSDGAIGYDPVCGSLLSDAPYFEQRYDRTDSGTLANEIDVFSSASFFEENTPQLPKKMSRRRVHFARPKSGVADNDASFSEEDDFSRPFVPRDRSLFTVRPPIDKAKYPDKRLERKKAGEVGKNPKNEDHSVPRTQESDNPDDKQSVFGFQVSDDSASDEPRGSASGYESDLGETTEEEEIPPSRPQAILRRPSISSVDDVIQTSTLSRRQPDASNPGIGFPIMGFFHAQPTRKLTVLKTGTRFLMARKNNNQMKAHPGGNVILNASPSNSLTTTIPYNGSQQPGTGSLETDIGIPPPVRYSGLVESNVFSPSSGMEQYLISKGWMSPGGTLVPFATADDDIDDNDDDYDDESAHIEYEDVDHQYDEVEGNIDVMEFLNYSDDSADQEAVQEDFLDSTSDPGLYDDSFPVNTITPYAPQNTTEQSEAFQIDQSVDSVGPLSPLRKRRPNNGFGGGGSFNPPEIALKRRALHPC